MATYTFKVEERAGVLAYDAVEHATNTRLQLGPTMVVGSYPEITTELTNRLGVVIDITYRPHVGDTFDQGAQTWTYQRQGDTIIVEDMPRTVFRLTALGTVQ